MNRRFARAALFAAALVAVAVGVVSYNAGVSHGLAIAAPPPGAPAGAVGPYYWYRPWGFGFGPLAILLFWFLLFRVFFWGGFHRRRWYYPGPYDIPPRFEEWHRRAHERMNSQPPAQSQGA